jgi:hypothetical protein
MIPATEDAMHDPIVGTWTLNCEKSGFDPNHRPTAGSLRLERDTAGAYILNAEGLNAKGERVAERPQRLVPDGQAYPVPDFPGLTAVTTQPDPRTLHAEVRREDGSLVGEGRYVVAADGQSMEASTAGFDTQLRRFETRTHWDRA